MNQNDLLQKKLYEASQKIAEKQSKVQANPLMANNSLFIDEGLRRMDSNSNVVDADTVDGYRFTGVDAFESDDQFGSDATQFTKDYLQDNEVTGVYQGRDAYGRELISSDEMKQSLIESGYATPTKLSDVESAGISRENIRALRESGQNDKADELSRLLQESIDKDPRSSFVYQNINSPKALMSGAQRLSAGLGDLVLEGVAAPFEWAGAEDTAETLSNYYDEAKKRENASEYWGDDAQARDALLKQATFNFKEGEVTNLIDNTASLGIGYLAESLPEIAAMFIPGVGQANAAHKALKVAKAAKDVAAINKAKKAVDALSFGQRVSGLASRSAGLLAVSGVYTNNQIEEREELTGEEVDLGTKALMFGSNLALLSLDKAVFKQVAKNKGVLKKAFKTLDTQSRKGILGALAKAGITGTGAITEEASQEYLQTWGEILNINLGANEQTFADIVNNEEYQTEAIAGAIAGAGAGGTANVPAQALDMVGGAKATASKVSDKIPESAKQSARDMGSTVSGIFSKKQKDDINSNVSQEEFNYDTKTKSGFDVNIGKNYAPDESANRTIADLEELSEQMNLSAEEYSPDNIESHQKLIDDLDKLERLREEAEVHVSNFTKQRDTLVEKSKDVKNLDEVAKQADTTLVDFAERIRKMNTLAGEVALYTLNNLSMPSENADTNPEMNASLAARREALKNSLKGSISGLNRQSLESASRLDAYTSDPQFKRAIDWALKAQGIIDNFKQEVGRYKPQGRNKTAEDVSIDYVEGNKDKGLMGLSQYSSLAQAFANANDLDGLNYVRNALNIWSKSGEQYDARTEKLRKLRENERANVKNMFDHVDSLYKEMGGKKELKAFKTKGAPDIETEAPVSESEQTSQQEGTNTQATQENQPQASKKARPVRDEPVVDQVDIEPEIEETEGSTQTTDNNVSTKSSTEPKQSEGTDAKKEQSKKTETKAEEPSKTKTKEDKEVPRKPKSIVDVEDQIELQNDNVTEEDIETRNVVSITPTIARNPQGRLKRFAQNVTDKIKGITLGSFTKKNKNLIEVKSGILDLVISDTELRTNNDIWVDKEAFVKQVLAKYTGKYVKADVETAARQIWDIVDDFIKTMPLNLEGKIAGKTNLNRGQFAGNKFTKVDDNVLGLLAVSPLNSNNQKSYNRIPSHIKALTAIASLQWVNDFEEGMLIRTPEKVEGLFAPNKNVSSNIPSAIYNKYASIGSLESVVARDIGNSIMSNIKMNLSEDAPSTLKDALATGLGLYGVSYLRAKGIVKSNSVTVKEFVKDGSNVSGFEAQEVKSPDGKIKFIAINTERVEGVTSKSENVKKFISPLQLVKDFNDKVFDIESSKKYPLTEKPKNSTNKRIKKNKADTPSEIKDRIDDYSEQPFRFNMDLMNILLNEEGGKDYVLSLLGWGHSIDDYKQSKHVSKRDSIQAQYDADVRDLDYLIEVYNDTGDVPYYFTHDIKTQLRNHIDQNTINPQNSKVQRLFFQPESVHKKVDQDFLKEHDEAYRTTAAVALGLDEKMSYEQREAMLKAAEKTINEIADNEHFGFISDKYGDDVANDAVDVISDLRNTIGDPFHEDTVKAIMEVISNSNSNIKLSGIDGINGLLEVDGYLSVKNGTRKSYVSRTLIEVDGVTNGFALGLIQFPVLDTSIFYLNKVGVYFDDTNKNFNEFITDPSTTDSYQSIIAPLVEVLALNPELKKLVEFITGPLIDDDGNVTGNARKLIKQPFMVYNYGAGGSTIRNAVLDDLEEAFYEKIASIHAMDLVSKQEQLATLNKLFGTTVSRKNMDRILEMDFSEVVNKKIRDKNSIGRNLADKINNLIELSIGELGAVRDIINDSYMVQFEIFYKVYKDLYNKFTNNGEKDLSIGEANQLIKATQSLIPKYYSPSSYVKGNRKENASKDEYVPIFSIVSRNTGDKVVLELKENIDGIGKSTSASITVDEYFNGGVSGLVKNIHSMDADIISKIKVAALRVHDAIKTGAIDAVEGSRQLNNAVADLIENYDLIGSVLRRQSDSLYMAKSMGVNLFEVESNIKREKKRIGVVGSKFTIDDHVGNLVRLHNYNTQKRKALFNREITIDQYPTPLGGGEVTRTLNVATTPVPKFLINEYGAVDRTNEELEVDGVLILDAHEYNKETTETKRKSSQELRDTVHGSDKELKSSLEIIFSEIGDKTRYNKDMDEFFQELRNSTYTGARGAEKKITLREAKLVIDTLLSTSNEVALNMNLLEMANKIVSIAENHKGRFIKKYRNETMGTMFPNATFINARAESNDPQVIAGALNSLAGYLPDTEVNANVLRTEILNNPLTRKAYEMLTRKIPFKGSRKQFISNLARNVWSESVTQDNVSDVEARLSGPNPEGVEIDLADSVTKQTITKETLVDTFESIKAIDNVNVPDSVKDVHEKVISTIIDSLMDRIDSIGLNELDQADFNFGAVKDNIVYLNKGDNKSTPNTQSMQEIFLHELLHIATEDGVLDSNLRNQLINLNQFVADNTDYTIFLDKDSNGNIVYGNDKEAEIAAAKEFYAYAIERPMKKGMSSLEQKQELDGLLLEFIAFGLTNEKVIEATKNLDTRKQATDKFEFLNKIQGDNFIGKLINTLYAVLESVLGRASKKQKGITAQDKLFNIAVAMQSLQNQYREDVWDKTIGSKADKVNQGVSSIIDSAIDRADRIKQRFTKATDNAINEDAPLEVRERFIQDARKILIINNQRNKGMTREDALTDAFSKVETVEDAKKIYSDKTIPNRFYSEGFFMNVFNTLKGSSSLSTEWHKLFNSYKSRVDRARERIRDVIAKEVRDSMSGLNKTENKSVTVNVIASDMTSLIDTFGEEAVKEFYSNPKKLNEAINKYKKEIENNVIESKYTNGYLEQAEGLAELMITGSSSKHNQQSNAENIAYGFAWKSKKYDLSKRARSSVKDLNKLVDDLDVLISLLAQRQVPETSRSTFKAIWDNRPDAISNIVDLHRGFKNNSKNQLFKGTENLQRKGYFSTLYQDHYEIAHESMKYNKDMKAEGWNLVRTVDSREFGGNEIGIYKRRKNTSNEFVTGIFSIESNQSKGTTLTDLYKKQEGVFEGRELAEYRSKMNDRMTKEAIDRQLNGVARPNENMNIAQPIVNPKGETVDYRYQMSEIDQQELLNKNYDIADVMADMEATVISKTRSVEANQQAFELAVLDYEDSYSIEPENFMWISSSKFNEDGTINEFAEQYRLLPQDVRDQIRAKWGGRGIPLRKGLVRNILGGDKYSFAQSNIVNAFQDRFPNVPIRKVMQFTETLWQEIVKTAKIGIVIRTPAVLTFNVISNLSLGIARGIPPHKIIQDYFEGIRYLKEFEKLEKEKMLIEAKLEGREDVKDRSRLARINSLLEDSPINEMIQRGLFQTIAEDIDQSTYGYLDTAQRKLSEASNKRVGGKVTDSLEWVGSQLFMTSNSAMFKTFNKATQYSDFIARYSLIKNELRKNAKAEKPLTRDEIFQDAVDTFINYDLHDHKALQYANDMGLVMFTKFYLGIQHVIGKTFKRNSATSAMVLSSQAFIGDFEDISGESVFVKSPDNKFHPDPMYHIETATTPYGIQFWGDLIDLVKPN